MEAIYHHDLAPIPRLNRYANRFFLSAVYTPAEGTDTSLPLSSRCQCCQVAIEGCCHGELDNIYATLAHLEKVEGKKVDLLICCGDFQVL